MNAARPVRRVLADALAKPARARRQRLAPARLLFVGHRPEQVLDKAGLPSTLLKLADACPADAADTAMRLRLKALAAADAKAPAHVDAATRASVLALLADPARAREQTDMLTNYAAEIVHALSARGAPARTRCWPPSTAR